MNFDHYENYGFERFSAFNLATGAPDRSYRAHWHPYGEIVVAGPGRVNLFRVNRQTYSLAEGDLLLIWPMELHEILDADREKSLIIQFSNGFMNALSDLRRIMHACRGLHLLAGDAHGELVRSLRAITERMRAVCLSAEPNRELRCCMLLMEFMMALDGRREELAPELACGGFSGDDDTAARRILRVTDYIRNNLTADDLSESAMARLAGVSRDYFSRVFRGVTGMNYARWLNAIRLEKAAELLADPGLSVTEAAMNAGFQSISSFNRVFHAEKGMSPGEYRTLMM